MRPFVQMDHPRAPAHYVRLAATRMPSVRILPGVMYALTGPNGSGKSTLLRMLAGLVPCGCRRQMEPSECRVYLLPTDLRQFLLPWHRIRVNIELFVQHHAKASTEAAHLHDRVMDVAREILPGAKLSECIDNRPGQLSSGQRAAVCLGIAVALNPHVLLLDETLANLSLEARTAALHLLRERALAKRSTVLTTHSRSLIQEHQLEEIPLD